MNTGVRGLTKGLTPLPSR